MFGIDKVAAHSVIAFVALIAFVYAFIMVIENVHKVRKTRLLRL